MSKKLPDGESILFGDSESSGRSGDDVFRPELILELEISQSTGGDYHDNSRNEFSVDEVTGLDIGLDQYIDKVLDVVISSEK